MKTTSIGAFIFLIASAGVASADVFYNNSTAPEIARSFTSGDEIADDVPFSGSHTVTGFSAFFHADVPVVATFKFYDVNPANGRPGNVIASFTGSIPAGDNVFTRTLTPAQQFVWTATPRIYNIASLTGGFFSVQFRTPAGGSTGSTAGWFLAFGQSEDGFVDVTTGDLISFQHDVVASMNLLVTDDGANGAAALQSLQVSPAQVDGGQSAQGFVTLTNIAPAGGITVTLLSGDPNLVQVPPSVTVPAGATSAAFTITTRAVTTVTSVGLSATFGGRTANASITVGRPTPVDTVGITEAEYRAGSRELRVSATSSSAGATLTVFVTSTNAAIGTLSGDGRGRFSGRFRGIANPGQITVRSSAGGSATRAVTVH